MQSQRYRDLRRRIAVLKRRLPQASPIGFYSPRQIDATLSFRLLSHAELEACIEDLAATALNSAYVAYQFNLKIDSVLLSLAAHYGGFKLSGGFGRDGTDRVLRDAVTSHSRVIRTNHGVRERTLVKLLAPLGVKAGDLDPKWVADIDSFGSRRGATAHSSVGALAIPDPVQERKDVTALVDGLAGVDKLLLR
ncbi:MAG: hypothetical protein ACREXR_20040 [Gammaproteobacteria bacterium]